MSSRRERRMLRSRGERYVPKKEEPQPRSTPKEHKWEATYKKYYKQLMFIPFIILLVALGILYAHYAQTGEFIDKGVSLKGGITLTVQTDKVVDAKEVQADVAKILGVEVNARAMTQAGQPVGIIIDAADVSEDELVAAVKQVIGDFESYSVEEIGASLGESFFKETMIALLLAFIFMGVVVFAYFRTPIPSAGIMLAAASDMIITLAVLDIMGVKLSTAGIAALLMLIGYSVDTDILLTTRVLRHKEGTVFTRMLSAMKTGLTMTATTMAALIVGLIVTQSEVLKQILLILFIGLIVDVVVTWLQNTGILMWFMERREKA